MRPLQEIFKMRLRIGVGPLGTRARNVGAIHAAFAAAMAPFAAIVLLGTPAVDKTLANWQLLLACFTLWLLSFAS